MATLAQRYDPAYPIDQLVEHPDNPRRGDEASIDASMAVHGFYGAVIAQASTRHIIAGNHRTRVARRRGETTVPVLWLEVDDEQARRLLLVDNRTADDAKYNMTELTRLLAELDLAGEGLAGTGYDETDLARLVKRWGTVADPDDVPPTPPPRAVRSQRGDLWILGRHRLLCGDSTNGDDVGRLLDGITPRLMVTDPPYLVNYQGGRHHGHADKNWDAYRDPTNGVAFYRDFLLLAVAHLAPSAPVYQWHSDNRQDLIAPAWEAAGLFWHQTVYWIKTNAVLTFADFRFGIERAAYGWRKGHRPPHFRRPPNGQSNAWALDAGRGFAHPTIKPVQLYTDPYTWHLRAGEWAYEPFSGSGTAIAAAETVETGPELEGGAADHDDGDADLEAVQPPTDATGLALVAGEVTGRRVAAMELEPAFVDVACLRWQRLTGRLPVLEATGAETTFET